MSATTGPAQPRVTERSVGDVFEVSLAGTWRITESRPSWTELLGTRNPNRVRLKADEVERWDSSLLLFLFEAQQWCRATGAHCDVDALPEKVRAMLSQLAASHETSVPFDRSRNFLATVG